MRKLFKNSIQSLSAIILVLSTFTGFSALAAETNSDTYASPSAPREQRRPRVGEIDPADKEKYRTRYEAKNSTLFSFGPGFSNNLNSSKALYSLGFGYEWEVGSQNAVTAQVDGHFGESTAYIDGIIGGKYYFTDEDVSPFVKAGFGFGTSKGKDLDNIGGFAGTIGLGATVFRTSSTHLEVLAAYSTLFATNAQGTPSVASISLGILF